MKWAFYLGGRMKCDSCIFERIRLPDMSNPYIEYSCTCPDCEGDLYGFTDEESETCKYFTSK